MKLLKVLKDLPMIYLCLLAMLVQASRRDDPGMLRLFYLAKTQDGRYSDWTNIFAGGQYTKDFANEQKYCKKALDDDFWNLPDYGYADGAIIACFIRNLVR